MGIEGHKERALQRRGYKVQEALKRRNNLNELASLRRKNLLFEEEREELKLSQRCREDIAAGKKDSVYCPLSELLDDLLPNVAQETYIAITDIYNFFKPIKNDNRAVFSKIMKVILKNENPSNSLLLIAKFLVDPAFATDEIKRRLLELKNSEIVIPATELEGYLRKAREKEYSKYEDSFGGQNFSVERGSSKLSYGKVDPAYGKENQFKMFNSVYEGRRNIQDFVNYTTRGILATDPEDFLYKADLAVKNNLLVGKEIIIPKGANIEVKKIDYELDSYFSEYLAIYKNDMPAVAYQDDFKNLYNDIIDSIFEIVSKEGQFMIQKVNDNIDGIIFDKNLIVLKKDLDFYWSNKGQRGCTEKRLSIRFRIKNPNITAYLYDKVTHNNQLKPQEIEVNVKPRIYC